MTCGNVAPTPVTWNKVEGLLPVMTLCVKQSLKAISCHPLPNVTAIYTSAIFLVSLLDVQHGSFLFKFFMSVCVCGVLLLIVCAR